MSKFTPGPWQVMPEECDKPYIRIRGTVLGGRHKIANVITPSYDGVHAREAEETRANSRLISAAPDLLQALQEIVKNDPYKQSPAGSIARAAIAKALGESS